MNVLIGLYQPTEGAIYLDGKKVRIDSPAQAVKLGIGMVHQHFMLVEAMTVFENIILGDRNTKGVFIDREARKKEILELSARYGLDVELDKPITEIAVGAQQRVEILKALYRGAELLILDEPSAALTDIEVEACSTSCASSPARARASSSSATRCGRSCGSPTGSPFSGRAGPCAP
jgi:simple sugar transport system ATP-binding protein